jgi:hypothetical protein
MPLCVHRLTPLPDLCHNTSRGYNFQQTVLRTPTTGTDTELQNDKMSDKPTIKVVLGLANVCSCPL